MGKEEDITEGEIHNLEELEAEEDRRRTSAHTEFLRQNGLDSVLSSSLSWKLRRVDLASADREKSVRDGIGYRCLSQCQSPPQRIVN